MCFFPLSGVRPVPVFVQGWMEPYMTFKQAKTPRVWLHMHSTIYCTMHEWHKHVVNNASPVFGCTSESLSEEAVVWQLRNAETSLCFSFLISVWHTHTQTDTQTYWGRMGRKFYPVEITTIGQVSFSESAKVSTHWPFNFGCYDFFSFTGIYTFTFFRDSRQFFLSFYELGFPFLQIHGLRWSMSCFCVEKIVPGITTEVGLGS